MLCFKIYTLAEVADKFKTLCVEHGFPPHLILPHGSYLLNLGSPKEEQREKSVQLLVEELGRCHKLGLNLFNIHPGSSCGEISRSRYTGIFIFQYTTHPGGGNKHLLRENMIFDIIFKILHNFLIKTL